MLTARNLRGTLVAAAVGLFAAPAGAGDGEAHFGEVPFARLVLTDTVSGRHAAVIEGPDGLAELVHEGDLIGLEGIRVLRVDRGCVALGAGGDAGPALLCVNEPAAPRS